MSLPVPARAAMILLSVPLRNGSLLASFAPSARRDPRRCRLVVMVWPCTLTVDVYVAAGREVEFPRPPCPACAGPLVFWSGYRRWLRAADRCWRIFVPRLRCGPCAGTHALLPAFVLAWRLDQVETIGSVIALVAGGRCGVRPAADRAGVPYTAARGWVRRFRGRALVLGTAFAALAAELGGEPMSPA